MVENAQGPTVQNLRVRAEGVVSRLENVLEGLRLIIGRVHGEPPAQSQPAAPTATQVPPTPPISASVSSAHNTLGRVEKLIEEIKEDL